MTDPERQTKMKTNDGRGKKKRVLLHTEKFITRSKVNSTAYEQLSSASKRQPVAEFFRKQALKTAFRKEDERASILDEETSHPL